MSIQVPRDFWKLPYSAYTVVLLQSLQGLLVDISRAHHAGFPCKTRRRVDGLSLGGGLKLEGSHFWNVACPASAAQKPRDSGSYPSSIIGTLHRKYICSPGHKVPQLVEDRLTARVLHADAQPIWKHLLQSNPLFLSEVDRMVP